MDTVISVLVVVALVAWGYWNYRTSGPYYSNQYSSKRPPPNLTGFRPKSGNAAQDNSTIQPMAEDPRIEDVANPA
jgi:hypothetical protein